MNSIEEDIKILEVENYYLEELGYLRENNHFIKFNQALKNLIKAYKELKEIEENHRQENGKLRERVKEMEENINKQKQLTKIAQTITDESIKEALIEFEKDYIPVSLVEEKIEELNEYYKKEIYPSLMNWSDVDITEYYDGMIGILQELLEKRK